ncbi:MAG: hypothetical protein K9M97_14065 [Akkermansiaceae bacterium]|nr:hypothetical protein [Akkermansiaceae bacterium]
MRYEAFTLSDVVFVAALGVLLVAGVPALVVIVLRGWRESKELKRLKDAQRHAVTANENVRRGLKTMASIMPGLGGEQLALSARAMDLLDTQSGLLLAMRRANRRAIVRRPRARRMMAQQLREISDLDQIYESFQQAMLTAVCEHAARRVIMPPLGTSKYRAVFTVLEHQLPGVLWPAMNQILARQVQLWVRNADGIWKPARRTGFRWGRELVFNRKNLEQATELRLVVTGRIVSEFTVEHERTATS